MTSPVPRRPMTDEHSCAQGTRGTAAAIKQCPACRTKYLFSRWHEALSEMTDEPSNSKPTEAK